MRDLKALVVGGVSVHVALGLLIATLFFGTGLYWWHVNEQAAPRAASEPLLGEGFGASRLEEEATLKSYKKLEGERFQIPIDRAMSLIVKEKGAAPAAPQGGVN